MNLRNDWRLDGKSVKDTQKRRNAERRMDALHEWRVQCRQEDLLQREIINEERRVLDVKRQIYEKTQQLEALAGVSVLIGGFCLSNIVEPNYHKDANQIIATVYCSFGSCGVGLLLLVLVQCTYCIVGIHKFDCTNPDASFLDFWRKRCEDDWQKSYVAFTLGVPFCLVCLSLGGWMILTPFLVANILFCSITGIAIVFFILFTHAKWGGYLTSASPNLVRMRSNI